MGRPMDGDSAAFLLMDTRIRLRQAVSSRFPIGNRVKATRRSPEEMADPLLATPAVTLALRGERVAVRHAAIASVLHPQRKQLLVVTGPAVYLFGRILESGGDLIASHNPEPNALFCDALYLPWLDSYGVVAVHANGSIRHEVLSADLQTSAKTHDIAVSGAFLTAIANPFRHEEITCDTDGGFKVWVLRAASSFATTRAAAPVTGFKGILRVHTADRATRSAAKPLYRHVCLSSEGQTIFAATLSRIHIYDAASCLRLAACFRDQPRRTITRMAYDSTHDYLHLGFGEDRSKIFTFALVQRRNSELTLKQVSVHDDERDSWVAFASASSPREEANPFDSSDDHERPSTATGSAAKSDGLFMLDDCGRFSVVDFQGDAAKTKATPCSVSLDMHMNPLAERFHAIHCVLGARNRNFVFLVCSSGFWVVEAFLPSAFARLAITVTPGRQLKLLESRPAPRMLIYQQLQPVSRIMLYDDDYRDFRFVEIPSLSDSSQGAQLDVVEFAACDDHCLAVLWSNGVVATCAAMASNDRMRMLTSAIEPQLTATTMTIIRLGPQQLVGIGDVGGSIHIWTMDEHPKEITTKRIAHQERISMLASLDSTIAEQKHYLLLLSVARSGEVKVWSLTRLANQDFQWDVLVRFRTYAGNLSAASVLASDFLFCGFDSGSMECWHLPLDKIPARGTPHARITVVKHALHAIDLHLTPVVQINVEPDAIRAAARSKQSKEDAFSWVVSYDLEGVVLIWCFNLDLFFPHRRIRVHDPIKGSFLRVQHGITQLIAHIGNCVEKLDQLTSFDIDAVKDRLTKGRELSEKRYHVLQAHTSTADAVSSASGSSAVNAVSSSSSGLGSVIVSEPLDFLAPVRISITLPGVDPTMSARPTEIPSKSENSCVQESTGLTAPMSNSSDVSAINPVMSPPSPVVAPRAATCVPLSPVGSPIRTANGRGEIVDFQDGGSSSSRFLPGMNSIPSSFRQAKPRVYRNNRLLTAPSQQTRCAVITTTDFIDDGVGYQEEPDLSRLYDAATLAREANLRSANLEPRDKVAVVSLVDDDDEALLMLDFRAKVRRRQGFQQQPKTKNDDTTSESAPSEIRLASWEVLSEAQRKVELMAATKSRCIQKDAQQDSVHVPALEDFDSTDVNVQISVRAFTRWFAATRHHRQRIREHFLTEELQYASHDPIVHQELARHGRSPPPRESVGDTRSRVWHEFATWYATGSSPGAVLDQSLLKQRMHARADYLQQRLDAFATFETKQTEAAERTKARSSNSSTSSVTNEPVFIFDCLEMEDEPKGDNSITSWAQTSVANRQKEIALALMDPMIQIGAMKQEIELPDLSAARLDDFDIFALAGKFLPWWAADGNQYRQDFLQREVDEALRDENVMELLAQEAAARNESAPSSQNVLEAYFRSDQARWTFLKKKLFYLKRKSRIASVERYGKLPVPIMFETLVRPMSLSFAFPEPAVVIHEIAAPIDVETEEAVTEVVCTVELSRKDSVKNFFETVVALQGIDPEYERMLMTQELELMALEDDISRELNALLTDRDSDDEDESKPLSVSKRSDFSNSYFFASLPQHFRALAQSSWASGSGIDNGDEEIEEEERLERERERQRRLDEIEAERIAEEERRAERLRLEKEREERAFQFRRLRQAELKRVLAVQAKLEAKRAQDLENERMANELQAMAQEEQDERQRLARLLQEHNMMLAEDLLAATVRKETHDRRAKEMRRLLTDQAQMLQEDKRCWMVEIDSRTREHDQAERRAYLTDLYSSFHPFFPATNNLSEDFLPALQVRCLERERMKRRNVKTAAYTLPAGDAMLLDEVEPEAYVARDSRKFKLLLGLPLRSPPNTRMAHRIPTELDIIRQRQMQQIGLETEMERLETPSVLPSVIPPHGHQHLRNRQSRTRYGQRPHAPELVEWKKSAKERSMTDLNQVEHENPSMSQKSAPKTRSEQRDQLPFFRGNLIVRGENKARSKDYSC